MCLEADWSTMPMGKQKISRLRISQMLDALSLLAQLYLNFNRDSTAFSIFQNFTKFLILDHLTSSTLRTFRVNNRTAISITASH